jgi:tetratricopeptide (TPR) repeat protein
MSRFSNLEIGGESEDLPTNQGAVSRDQAYYSAQALEAFQNGDFEPALRSYSKVLEFNPDAAEAWTGQVRMLIELGEFREARLWADKAIEHFPHEPELLAAKAVALGRGGDLESALAFSDAALEERGNTPYVWLARGDVLLAREEARADYCIEKAMMLAHGDWVVAWLAARIRRYYAQFALALKLLQQAIEWHSGHFLLWLELGQCQQALGLVGPARQSFDAARQLNPKCREAAHALARLAHVGPSSRLRGLWHRVFRRL